MPTSSQRVAAALAAALLAHACPAAARDDAADLDHWKARVERSLRRALAEPRPTAAPSVPPGVAEVTFGLDADGRAADARVLHPSGERALDRVAVRAVRRIRAPGAPPAVGGRIILARVFIAPGDRPLDARGMRDMLARTAARQGWADRDRVAVIEPLLIIAAR